MGDKVLFNGGFWNLEPAQDLWFSASTYHHQRQILIKKMMMSISTLYWDKEKRAFIFSWAAHQEFTEPGQLPKNMTEREFLKFFDYTGEWQAWLNSYEVASQSSGSMGSFFNPDKNPVLNQLEPSDSESDGGLTGSFQVDEEIFSSLFQPLYTNWLNSEVKSVEPLSEGSLRAENPLSQGSDVNERYTGPCYNMDYLLGDIQPKDI